MMMTIIESLGATGAGLASAAITMGIFFGAIAIGCKVAEIRGKAWQGWVSGILAFALLGVTFYPATEALTKEACKNADDFRACVEGDDS